MLFNIHVQVSKTTLKNETTLGIFHHCDAYRVSSWAREREGKKSLFGH